MCVCVCYSLSCIQLFLTIAHQAPLSVGFSRQECWSGLPCLPQLLMVRLRRSNVSLGRKTQKGSSAQHIKETLYPRALSQTTLYPRALSQMTLSCLITDDTEALITGWGESDRLLHHEVTPSKPRLLHLVPVGEVTVHTREGGKGLHSHPGGCSVSVNHLISAGVLSPLKRLNHFLMLVWTHG